MMSHSPVSHHATKLLWKNQLILEHTVLLNRGVPTS